MVAIQDTQRSVTVEAYSGAAMQKLNTLNRHKACFVVVETAKAQASDGSRCYL